MTDCERSVEDREQDVRDWALGFAEASHKGVRDSSAAYHEGHYQGRVDFIGGIILLREQLGLPPMEVNEIRETYRFPGYVGRSNASLDGQDIKLTEKTSVVIGDAWVDP